VRKETFPQHPRVDNILLGISSVSRVLGQT